MIAIENNEAVGQNVRFVEVIRRMTRRLEAGDVDSAAKLGRMAYEAAVAGGIKARPWDDSFGESSHKPNRGLGECSHETD